MISPVPRIVAFGDEFFGASSIHPFNAMVRSALVPYRLTIDDFQCAAAQPDDRPSFIAFESDSIGRLKKVLAAEHEVLFEMLLKTNAQPAIASRSIKCLDRWNRVEHVTANLVRVLSVGEKGKL